jgi:hypothetical protein
VLSQGTRQGRWKTWLRQVCATSYRGQGSVRPEYQQVRWKCTCGGDGWGGEGVVQGQTNEEDVLEGGRKMGRGGRERGRDCNGLQPATGSAARGPFMKACVAARSGGQVRSTARRRPGAGCIPGQLGRLGLPRPLPRLFATRGNSELSMPEAEHGRSSPRVDPWRAVSDDLPAMTVTAIAGAVGSSPVKHTYQLSESLNGAHYAVGSSPVHPRQSRGRSVAPGRLVWIPGWQRARIPALPG